jgi:hypothetical protein
VVPLAGEGLPDLAVIEALARFQLMARRAGEQVWLEDVSAALGELLDLAGLRQALAGPAGKRADSATPADEAAGRRPGTAPRC